MSDLIDRQAAIDAINAVFPVDPNKSEYASGIACGAALASTYVKQLPSAELATNLQQTCNLASDCISRQDAIDAFYIQSDDNGWWTGTAEDMENLLKALPSVQPDGWLEQNKDKILQAGMEGREIDFRIGGRLFAIREKAQ